MHVKSTLLKAIPRTLGWCLSHLKSKTLNICQSFFLGGWSLIFLADRGKVTNTTPIHRNLKIHSRNKAGQSWMMTQTCFENGFSCACCHICYPPYCCCHPQQNMITPASQNDGMPMKTHFQNVLASLSSIAVLAPIVDLNVPITISMTVYNSQKLATTYQLLALSPASLVQWILDC